MGYQTDIYREQGGRRLVVRRQGIIQAENGGVVNIGDGGQLQIETIPITAAASEISKLAGTSANVTAANLNSLTDGTDLDRAAGGHGHLLAAGASDVTVAVGDLNALGGGGDIARAAGGHGHLLAAISDVTAPVGQVNTLAYDPGARALGVLQVDADVATTETVEIGADEYEVDVIQTDSNDDTAGGSWDNTTNPLTVDLAGADYDNLRGAIGVGDLILIQAEIMKCTAIVGTDHTFARARANTAAAAHGNGQDIFISAAPGAPATNFRVGLAAAVTPAAFSPALAAEINAEQTEGVNALVIANDEVLLRAVDVGVQTTALDETLMGADNQWSAANMYGGRAPSDRRVVTVARAPTAVEVALGNMHFPLDFTPTVVVVQVIVTADGAVTAWDGRRVITTNLVTLINTAGTDWAVTDTVIVTAWA